MGLHASISVQQECAGRRSLRLHGHSKTAGSQLAYRSQKGLLRFSGRAIPIKQPLLWLWTLRPQVIKSSFVPGLGSWWWAWEGFVGPPLEAGAEQPVWVLRCVPTAASAMPSHFSQEHLPEQSRRQEALSFPINSSDAANLPF